MLPTGLRLALSMTSKVESTLFPVLKWDHFSWPMPAATTATSDDLAIVPNKDTAVLSVRKKPHAVSGCPSTLYNIPQVAAIQSMFRNNSPISDHHGFTMEASAVLKFGT